MARGERNARYEDRAPVIDPWFTLAPEAAEPGYSQPDALDNAGYSLSDPGLDARLGDGFIPDDVIAPLGGPRLGRVSLATYGDDTVGPTPGGALGEAGAVWDRADYGGVPVGEFLGPQHAVRPAPVEYGRDLGVGEEHAFGGRPTGLTTVPRESRGPEQDGWRAAGPTEYQGRDLGRRPLSDGEVYADLYGEGRPDASPRGREDDGLATNDPADRGGDPAGYRLFRPGRDLRM
jgi:hypothetical protein